MATIDLLRWCEDETHWGNTVSSTLTYGIDGVPDGAPSPGSSALLKLPAELLEEVLTLLEPSDLAALSLASKACCKFARSELFKDVTLRYSSTSSMLVQKLVSEMHSSEPGASGSQGLGRNIRRLRIATSTDRPGHRHNLDLDGTLSIHGADQEDPRLQPEVQVYYQYIHQLALVLSSGVLANLHTLDWRDSVSTPKSVLDAISSCSATHLKLLRVEVVREFEITMQPKWEGPGWPLKSLHLWLTC